MPKHGYHSITISNYVYGKMYEKYFKNKEELSMQGISSLTGYLTFIFTKHIEENK